MKKNITETEVKSIDKMVLDNYEKHKDDDTWIVLDGIVDLDCYNQSKYRILWVLKEVYEIAEGDDNSMFDDWDIRKALNDLIRERKGLKGWAKTLTPIIYATFGLLNDILWDGMNNINDGDHKIVDIIKNIAYINIKKQPGRSTTNPGELKKTYYRDEAIILHQIDKFDPDIIVFGGTLHDYLIKGLSLKEENSKQFGDLKCYVQNDKIYIRTYHPSFRGGNSAKVEYVDGIIKAVRDWEKMKNE